MSLKSDKSLPKYLSSKELGFLSHIFEPQKLNLRRIKMAKMKEEITTEQNGYEVPALIIAPDKPTLVTGNFEEIEKTLTKWAKKVSKMALTVDNLDEVQAIKKAAVAVRNQLDAKVEAAKKVLFNDPKKIFEARMKALFTLIAAVESETAAVLDKVEAERRDCINEVLDHYRVEFQKQYKLDEEHFAQVEYRKNYYNKGMEEKLRKDDLEQQFKDLKKKQDAYEANVRLIISSCKDEVRINVERYIRDLVTSDVATIIEEIQKEKERLTGIDTTQGTTTATATAVEAEEVTPEEVTPEEVKTLVLGVPGTINWQTDFSGRTSTIKIQLIYPCDLGDSLKELFEGLKPFGIKIKQIKEKEVVF